ncbi:MAG: 3'-5' exonuclease [Chitinophagales bacterium]|nr:3'-5' exonuclease [Chitinophagales bacterium]MDW8428683.1 3'-5' exonuclease [Chitinophagales bacterium]
MDFIAIDFETANESSISACEIGIAVVRNNQLCESRGWLIRPPELRFLPHFTELHGINADQVRFERNFKELWDDLQHYLQGELLIAHNASFDLIVLASLLRYYRISFYPVQYCCSLQLARKVWGSRISGFSLKSLAHTLGIPLDHHRAESDARACALITQAVFREFQLTHTQEIESRLHVIPGELSAHRLTFPTFKYAQPPTTNLSGHTQRKRQHWKKR